MSSLDGFFNGGIIAITVTDSLDVPVISFETLEDIFGEGDTSVTIDGDVVIIIEGNELTKLQVTSERASLRGNTFLKTAITEDDIGVVVEDLKTRFVVSSSKLSFSSSQTNGIGDTLTKRTSGDLNTFSINTFRMARSPLIENRVES